jgi:peptidoglycan/xylan/chitin deacetylase (PgdA/CDA1 family)
MAIPPTDVGICYWPYDAPFAYSMTYDEGTVDCLANALPVHEEFDFPGHVDVVAGQLGQQRRGMGSSLNDYVHMGVEELGFLLGKGWGVGNHSWSHYVFPTQPGLDLWREVVWSKYTLEDQLDHPVRIFTIPNDKHNYEPVIELVKQHYTGCAYIDGAPNRDGFDPYRIGNFMVASGEISSHYDWKHELLTENLSLEFLRGSWLYETSHLVMWNVPQSHKCVTPEDLTRRFARLQEISEGSLWAAKPDDVLDYVRLRQNVGLNVLRTSPEKAIFEFTGSWPIGVMNARLCVRVSGLRRTTGASVEYQASPIPGGTLFGSGDSKRIGDDTYFMVDAVPGAHVTIRAHGEDEAGESPTPPVA